MKDPIKLIKEGLNNDSESEENDGLSKTESEARDWIVQRESEVNGTQPIQLIQVYMVVIN